MASGIAAAMHAEDILGPMLKNMPDSLTLQPDSHMSTQGGITGWHSSLTHSSPWARQPGITAWHNSLTLQTGQGSLAPTWYSTSVRNMTASSSWLFAL